MVRLYFVFYFIVFSSTAMANDNRGFDLKLGPYLSSLDYSESDDVSQHGSLSGFVARFSSYNSFSVVFAELNYSGGDVEYEYEENTHKVSHEVYDVKTMIGRAFYLSESSRLTPYVGFGVRQSITDSRGQTLTASIDGYKSQQVYVYNPIGIELQELMTDSAWVVGGRVEFDSLIVVKNSTRLGEADDYEEVKVNQIKGRGYQLYVNFQRFLNAEGGAIVIEPFYKHWKASGTDDNSLPDSTADHTSNEWGIALMVSF